MVNYTLVLNSVVLKCPDTTVCKLAHTSIPRIPVLFHVSAQIHFKMMKRFSITRSDLGCHEHSIFISGKILKNKENTTTQDVCQTILWMLSGALKMSPYTATQKSIIPHLYCDSMRETMFFLLLLNFFPSRIRQNVCNTDNLPPHLYWIPSVSPMLD